MSKLKTTTSNARPTDPQDGELFFETDTNRMIFWDGGMWHVYNRTSTSFASGNLDEIHYPQGLYSDPTAPYYVSSSPMYHFDALHINGLDKTQVYADGEWAQTWYDRTHNRWKFDEQESGADASMDLQYSSTFSDGYNTMPSVNSNAKHYTAQDATAPNVVQGDNTFFYVLAGGDHVSPWSNYASWYRNSNGSNYHYMGANFNASHGAAFPAAWHKTISPASGATLFIGRNQFGGKNAIWRADNRNLTKPRVWNPSSNAISLSRTNGGPAGLFHTSSGYGVRAYEVIMFDAALSIAEINRVKDYLQNKYAGLGDNYFPIGGTDALLDIDQPSTSVSD